MTDLELQNRAINTIRFLSADGVQKANSGHPGLPMGTAAMAYTIWTRHLKINPANPDWSDRDRFVLSGGHGSMLLYSLLHLTGYDLSLEQLKNFRQWGSLTPGHPEYGLTPGVDATTGPLGQGLSNGVGMAIAEAHLAAEFNQEDGKIVDHYTYAIVTDGDLMEGVASEAASLAGHLKLGKLIYLYDDNHISIEGSTDVAFTEDRGKRFEAYGWHVLRIKDGNDVDEIDAAIQAAKQDERPSLIICPTTIGFGLPTKQGTAKAHGEPPGEDELANAKNNFCWPQEPFYVADDVKAHFLEVKEKGQAAEKAWNESFKQYAEKHPDLAKEYTRRFAQELPQGWDKDLKQFDADAKGMATRKSSSAVLNEIADKLPELMGGSADLAPSNNTWINSSTSFQPDNPIGRNLQFGVREHGMGAVVNGMAYHKGLIPYGATFLVFSDYMRGALRVAALSHLNSIWVYTHDSIGLGEDGPTHQPVEHVMSLRAMPNLSVIRPCDANEVREAWKAAVTRKHGPTALVLTRQNLPTLDRAKEYAAAEGLQKGAYVLADLGKGDPEIILMASGSEVSLIIEAGKKLAEEGKSVRLVSFPCWDLFEAQSDAYKQSVLPDAIQKRVSVEAGVTMGWGKWVGSQGVSVGLDHFGASAPGGTLFKEFGFTADNVYATAKKLFK
ncbi:MAG: transketolase [Chloroflexota bacterium]|nr:transketolase [Chloroflexota bacterium]